MEHGVIVEQPRWTPLLVRGLEKLASYIPVHGIGNTTPGVWAEVAVNPRKDKLQRAPAVLVRS